MRSALIFFDLAKYLTPSTEWMHQICMVWPGFIRWKIEWFLQFGSFFGVPPLEDFAHYSAILRTKVSCRFWKNC